MESIDIKRAGLQPGAHVKILSDDWFIHNKHGIMLDPNPVIGSSQCIVEIEGEAVTLPIHDVFKFEGT